MSMQLTKSAFYGIVVLSILLENREENTMKISVSAYSFSRAIREGRLSLLDTVEKAKEMGFEAIEFITLPGTPSEQKELAKALQRRAEAVGLPICAYAVGSSLYQPTREAMDHQIQLLKEQVDVASVLGCGLMRHDVVYAVTGEGHGRSFGLMLPYIAENARIVTEYAAAKGIKTCTENHGYLAQDSYRVEQLFNAVDHENYGLLVDVGNFVCADEDPVTAVSRVASYAVHVHAKDMQLSPDPLPGYNQTRGCNYFKGAVIGEGDVDVARCIKVLKRAGYNGYCSIEYEGSDDCIQSIAKGYQNLKQMIENA